MVRSMAGLMVALALAAGPALADTAVVLRDGLNGYDGTSDSHLTQSAGAAYGFGEGGAPTVGPYNSSFDDSLGLLRFDLTGINAASVTSATLKLYQYGHNYSGRRFKVQQLGMDWVEGTARDWPDYSDGANHRYRYAPEKVDSWTLDTGTTYAHTFSTALAPDQKYPADATRRWIRQGFAGGIRLYEISTGPTTGSAYADLASLNAVDTGATPFANGFGYYYDSGTDTIYMRTNTGVEPADIYYVDNNNAWDAVSRAAVGGFAGTSVGIASNSDLPAWDTLNVTDLVQRWLGTDAYAGAAQANYGVQFTSAGSTGEYYYLREATMYDPVNKKWDFQSGYVAANGVDMSGFRPTLEITYVPATVVPEPITVTLLALGGLGLVTSRRRRR
ncbi:MAG: hypothetical protein BIFFINMI_01064 [Phycisphaerae bacterium]|nr:hypothetical protein [Phycisphaerae bacterium]